ncbi:MAG: transglycosylase domain-containing protein [Spirochaetota bacterium]|nr:MAG: transglycosylase domain-containing protein [Spirochaetota bacterium]
MTLRERLGFRRHLRNIRASFKKANIALLLKHAVIIAGKLLLYVHVVLFILILILSVLYSAINPPITTLIVYRKIFFSYTKKPIEYVTLDNIPKKFQRMMIRVEDHKFYRHAGIDFEALINAYQINKRIGRIRYGGSTITMQLARTLFLVPTQSYLRKYLEILFALEMDLIMKKSRILELYLNYCEWGKGLYGIGAASSYYYNKNVNKLSTDECRRLVTILSSPLRYNVDTFISRKSMVRRYEFLVSQFP